MDVNNQETIYDIKPTKEDVGERLDKTLHKHIPKLSRTFLKELIKKNKVLINGKPTKPSYLIEGNEEITVYVPILKDEHEKILSELDIPVLFEDEWIIVIDKPAGIAVHPNDAYKYATIAQWAKWKFGDLPAPEGTPERTGIVHRLDRETSGVMIIARNWEAMRFLKQQFKKREIEKKYLAVVYGVPEFVSDVIEFPIGKDPNNLDHMRIYEEGGKESVTYYEILEDFGKWALCLCMPKTGRTHQIRVHMAGIGHSLIGDKIYHSPNEKRFPLPEDAPSMERHALHALSITITHPKTREKITFETEPPDDFKKLISWLKEQKNKNRDGS